MKKWFAPSISELSTVHTKAVKEVGYDDGNVMVDGTVIKDAGGSNPGSD